MPCHLLNKIFSGEIYSSIFKSLTLLAILLAWSLVPSLGKMTMAQAEPLLEPELIQSFSLQKDPSQQKRRFQDGIYLYGESPEAHQLGQAYMVFEAQQGRLVGAFYLPRSSFDCFSGVIEGNQLALNIVDSYTQQTHQYAIRYFQPATYATVSTVGVAQPITLEGFHQIVSISDNDRRMLNMCKVDLQ